MLHPLSNVCWIRKSSVMFAIWFLKFIENLYWREIIG